MKPSVEKKNYWGEWMESKIWRGKGSKDSYILQIMIRSKKKEKLCKDDIHTWVSLINASINCFRKNSKREKIEVEQLWDKRFLTVSLIWVENHTLFAKYFLQCFLVLFNTCPIFDVCFKILVSCSWLQAQVLIKERIVLIICC